MNTYLIHYKTTDGFVAEYWLNASSKTSAIVIFNNESKSGNLDYPCDRIVDINQMD